MTLDCCYPLFKPETTLTKLAIRRSRMVVILIYFLAATTLAPSIIYFTNKGNTFCNINTFTCSFDTSESDRKIVMTTKLLMVTIVPNIMVLIGNGMMIYKLTRKTNYIILLSVSFQKIYGTIFRIIFLGFTKYRF